MTPKSQGHREAVCQEHGPYTSRHIGLCLIRALATNVWSECPRCEDARQRREADARAIALTQRRQAETARRLTSAGIPERFASATFQNFVGIPQAPARANAERFAMAAVDGASKCAVFSGHAGTGKTHLACAVAKFVMDHNLTALRIPVARLFSRLQSSWGNGGNGTETQEDFFSVLAKTRLLILDDIGLQNRSQFESNTLTLVLGERYEAALPTLLISRLTPEDMFRLLGERVVDQLRQDGGHVTKFHWDSYRKGNSNDQ